MDGFNEKKWFVYLTDHHEGPFSLADVQTRLAQGQITAANYVWAEGMTDWKPMTDVPELIRSPAGSPAGQHGGSPIEQTVAPPQPEPTARPAATPAPSADTLSIEITQETPLETPNEEPKLDDPTVSGIMMPTVEEPSFTAPAAAARAAHSTDEPAKSASQHTQALKRALKWAVPLVTVAGAASAYLNGGLDPVLHSAAELAQPALLKLSEKVPALSKWISPIPRLEDVAPEDYETLKAAALQKPESGPKVAVAVSGSDHFHPTFYIASNLPDGATIDLYIQGIPDTLLNRLSFSAKTRAVIEKKFGKTSPLTTEDGKPLARGEYVIHATEALTQQPETVKAVLAQLPAVTAKVPDELPKDLKLLVSTSAFLGGPQDAVYANRLKEFHDKLRDKATAELAELKQLEATVESQLVSSSGKYRSLKGLARAGKPTLAAKKAWGAFDAKWEQLDGQLKDSFAKWTDPALQTEYFYGMIYSLTKSAGESVEKLHQLYNAYFTGATDAKTVEIQLGSAVSIAEGAVTALKNKISQAEALTPTPNGMPRREGL